VKEFSCKLREILAKNVGLSLWLVETIANQDFMREFIIDCALLETAAYTNSLIEVAMFVVYSHEREAIAKYNAHMESHEQLIHYLESECFADKELVKDG